MHKILPIILLGLLSFITTAKADCNNPTGGEGNQVYNLTYKTMQFCDGTNWNSMRGGVAGDEMGIHTATQDLNMDGHRITSVVDPANPQDAATKAYVDTNSGIASEADPQVNAVTSGKWCRGTGSQVTCDQDAPSSPLPSGTLCGLAQGSGASSCTSFASLATCLGVNIKNGSCPTGYTSKTSSGSFSTGGFNFVSLCTRFCVKQ